MPCIRRGLIIGFCFLTAVVFIPVKVRADQLKLNLAISSVGATCAISGGPSTIDPVSHGATTPQYTTTTSCDLSTGLPDGQALEATGTALATLGRWPAADVTASATSHGYNPSITPNYPNASASAYMVSQTSFSVSVNLNKLGYDPGVNGVPVLMTWTGETNVTGDGYAQISAWLQGGTYSSTPGVLSYTFAPDEQYGAALEAICSVEANENRNSACQAVADPTFTFDQAAFDAEMGSNTFLLADYYSFEFSPNMTATPPPGIPEPSSLILLGTGLLGLMGVALKRTIL